MRLHDETEMKKKAAPAGDSILAETPLPGTIIEEKYDPTEEKKLVEKALSLEATLKGNNYHNLRYFSYETSSDGRSTPGGPRACFIADYGSEAWEKQKRIIKLDRDIITGRAKVHFDNGCTTENDFNTLVRLGPEAFKYHISPVVDHWQVEDDQGDKHFITAEKFFENYKPIHFLMPPVIEKYRSIHTLMSELKKDPLTKKEFEKISSNVIDALNYIDSNNIYHRDLSLRNIITNIRNEDPFYESTPKAKFKKKYWEPIRNFLGLRKPHDQLGIEAIVTDFANSCYKDHPTTKPQQTMGARQVADPLMLTGKAYDDKAEVYAVAKDFLEMLVGEQITETDQINRVSKILKSSLSDGLLLYQEFHGKLLQIEHGFEYEEYYKILRKAISKLPGHAKKYSDALYKALSPFESERYSSTKDFIREWQKASKKDWWSRTKSAAKIVAASTLIGLSAVSAYKMLNPDIHLYKVHSGWNKETNEIDNNYVKLDFNIGYYGSYPIIGDVPVNARSVLVPAGENINVVVSAHYQPMDKINETTTKFNGKAYIEDAEDGAQEFILDPVEPGFASEFGSGGSTISLRDLKIPKDSKEGTVRNLIFELYAPADTGYSDSWNSEKQKLEFTPKVLYDKNKLLVRKKVSLVTALPNRNYISNPSIAVDFSSFDRQLAYPHAFYFNALMNGKDYVRLDKGIKYMFRIPELGVTEICQERSDWSASNSVSLTPNLPSGPSMDNLTMQMIAYKGDTLLSQSFLPMKRESVNTDSRSGWYSMYDRDVPNNNFIDKVKKYSKEAAKLIK